MRRLVYSPKVHAYIRTDYGIIDVSDHITGGNVTRVVNEVSTAELTLRNPNKIFTQPGNPAFRPMDGITIYLSRFKNHPVQVFTGYLDQTPYLKLFPGVCTLRASCTLKRLLYTYWDPGLVFSHDWLMKYGFLPDADGGQVTAQSGSPHNPDSPFTTLDNTKDKELTDAGFGKLLYGALRDIGNWEDGSILIERLPEGILATANKYMEFIEEDGDTTRKEEVEKFIRDLVGPIGGPGPGSGGGSGDNAVSGGKYGTLTGPEIKKIAMDAGWPGREAHIVAMIALAESSGNPKAEGDHGLGGVPSGEPSSFGLYQIHLPAHPDVTKACAFDPPCASRKALRIYRDAGGFTPWTTYNEGTYLNHKF